jgi:HD-GYP domain-containing protein (c-di-GMP phosphodiesterase class II)
MDSRARLSHPIAHGHDTVTLEQAIGLLAIAGDLAMGGSAARLTTDGGMVARLRRAGCPAAASAAPALQDAVACEVAGELAAAMGLPGVVESGLRQLPGPFAGGALAPMPKDDSLRAFLPASAPLALVADAIELKLPWLAGHARRVALLAQRAASLCGLPEAQQRLLARAALLHSLGRLAIPNPVWERPRRLNGAERDAVTGAPYWTARAASAVAGLEQETRLAAQAFARPGGAERDIAQQLLAAAVVHVALCSPRPWRAPHKPAAAAALLAAQATGGRLAHGAVRAVNATVEAAAAAVDAAPVPVHTVLSAREADVLRRLSLGQGQRDIARALRLSSGAVRTHADGIFGKLGCVTRQGATFKALTLGLI